MVGVVPVAIVVAVLVVGALEVMPFAATSASTGVVAVAT